MSPIPLRLRLVGVVVLLSALALALSGLAASTALRGFLLGRVDAQLSSTVSRLIQDPHLRGLSGAVAGSSSGSGSAGAGDADGNRGPDPLSDTFAEVVTATTTIRSALRSGVSAPALPSDLSQLAAGGAFTLPSLDGGHTWRAQIRTDGQTLVLVAVPLDGVEATMSRLVMIEIVGGAVVLVLLAGVGYVVVRRSLRPLVQVESTAERIAAGDLSQRVPEGHPQTEVGSLSRSFNTMVAQIEAAFAAQTASEAQARGSEERMRRFIGDASHELRTPLTSIRGFAELYRQGALPASEGVDLAMTRIESEARRMGGLVDDLLLLARLDQQRPLERAAVDLVALATSSVQDARAAAPARRIRLDVPVAGADEQVVDGDAGRLAQVLANLLTNAITHTSPQTPITVRVRARTAESEAVIEVIDQGPGISATDKAQIFDRFYRADVSRTRASGGSGLGLSIVAGILRAHGGRVDVSDTPGGGATFAVHLPAEPHRNRIAGRCVAVV